MKTYGLGALCGLAVLALAAGAHAQGSLPMDTPTQINGVETVCTGIGDEAQNDPRWKAYPVRSEFSNEGAQYLSGVHLTLSEGGKSLATLDCAGSWVLFKLASGNYKVSATLLAQPGGTPRSVSVSPPASGQQRFVIQFAGVMPNQ